ncbi:MAG: hypothetical protein IKV37_04625, partial [Prevotella sp.]|nr:hypothetical protein [Prevotella sp.]
LKSALTHLYKESADLPYPNQALHCHSHSTEKSTLLSAYSLNVNFALTSLVEVQIRLGKMSNKIRVSSETRCKNTKLFCNKRKEKWKNEKIIHFSVS